MLLVAMAGAASAWTFGPVTTTDSGGSTDSGTTPNGGVWTRTTYYKTTVTVFGSGSGDIIPPWLLRFVGS